MNTRKLIRELFFSTNKCNRSLAFELAKSANCHADVVEEFYKGLAELPHFMMLVNTYKASSECPSTTIVETEEERKQAYIEQFCDLYFRRNMSLNGNRADASRLFPKILLHCTFLEELDLSHNELEEIPEGIGRLHNLKRLNLSSNPKVKVLPTSLGNLKELECLNLSGIFDLFAVELSNYRGLYRFPTTIRKLQQLRHLNLQDVMLDELPTWIHELKHLESLHLFSGSGHLPPLTLPTTFPQLAQLKTLTIDAFTVVIPENIHEIKSLECLVVNHAKQVPSTISQLPNLRYLDLSYLSPQFLLADSDYKTLNALPNDFTASRLEIFDWQWLLQMTSLEEFIYKHTAPYQFTETDISALKKALPNCSFSFE